MASSPSVTPQVNNTQVIVAMNEVGRSMRGVSMISRLLHAELDNIVQPFVRVTKNVIDLGKALSQLTIPTALKDMFKWLATVAIPPGLMLLKGFLLPLSVAANVLVEALRFVWAVFGSLTAGMKMIAPIVNTINAAFLVLANSGAILAKVLTSLQAAFVLTGGLATALPGMIKRLFIRGSTPETKVETEETTGAAGVKKVTQKKTTSKKTKTGESVTTEAEELHPVTGRPIAGTKTARTQTTETEAAKKDLTLLGQGVAVLGQAAKTTGSALAAAVGPVVAIGGALAALGGVMAILVELFDPSTFKLLNLAVGDLFASLGEIFLPIVTALIPVVRRLADTVVAMGPAFKPLIEFMVEFVQVYGEMLGQSLRAVAPILVVIGGILHFLIPLLKLYADAISFVADVIVAVINTIIDMINFLKRNIAGTGKEIPKYQDLDVQKGSSVGKKVLQTTRVSAEDMASKVREGAYGASMNWPQTMNKIEQKLIDMCNYLQELVNAGLGDRKLTPWSSQTNSEALDQARRALDHARSQGIQGK